MKGRTWAAVVCVGLAVAWSAPDTARADEELSQLQTAPNKRKARKMLKGQNRRAKRTMKAAGKALKGDDGRISRLFPQGLDELRGSRQIQYSLRGGGEATTLLDPYVTTAYNIGGGVLAAKDRENLTDLYECIYGWLPERFRGELVDPSKGKLSKRKLRANIRKIGVLFDREFETIRRDITVTVLAVLGTQFIADCTTEVGYEAGDEVSERCAVSEYAAAGLMKNVDFALKDNLTCVKDQGRRGTCVAHAINAAVESQVMVNGGPATNLSEQATYFTAKVTSWFDGRYEDGLYPDWALDEFDADDYRIQYESNWTYNRSSFRDDLDPATDMWPDSCVGYFGEQCTDYAFQADETLVNVGFATIGVYDRPTPSPTDGYEITDYTIIPDLTALGLADFQLDVATACVEDDVPVILSIAVPDAFRNPDADGYIRHVAGQESEGGHAVLLVGFVSDADLPAGVAADPDGRGYYIIKNSWGTDWADCGFGYLSGEFMRIWGTGYRYIDDHLL